MRIADHDRGIGQRLIVQSLIEKGWPSEAAKSMLMALEGSPYAFEKNIGISVEINLAPAMRNTPRPPESA